uniref:Caspase family p20 domain-containing protein n=1 Tax=Anopheles minimus TaxID=112268 RepID=A0A1Y9IVH8_9DIPT
MAEQKEDIIFENYGTTHKRRGIALVFIEHKDREGSRKDLAAVEQVLKGLQFEVHSFNDCDIVRVREVLANVSKADHTQNDCILIVSMSHGTNSKIRFSDNCIAVDELWAYFVGNKCPSLNGKPKLVFVQACRGETHDPGVQRSTTDAEPVLGNDIQVSLPTNGDLLVMYSSYDDYVSYRDKNGSWFIQSLCKVLNSNIENKDVLSLLTHVTGIVANLSTADIKGKQIPLINSTLCKALYFPPKQHVELPHYTEEGNNQSVGEKRF